MAKQSNKLTAKTVKNLAYDPNSSNKHADGGRLYLFIHKNGSKYWRLDYRRPISQKRNTLAVGVYDEVTLEKARLKRDEVKRMLSDGIDPAQERNSHRNELKAKLENTFEKFATEWLKIHELEGKVDRETIRKMNRDILPFSGKKPVTDLFKSIQLDADVHNIRVFRLKGENQSIPFDPLRLKDLLLRGFNIGVNDYRTDDLYYHFYFKKTDHNKQPLPQEEWQLRTEVRLSNINHSLNDLQNVIKTGFKKLNFTQLEKSTTAEQQQLYSLYVRPYGQKQSLPILRNGHYRYFKNFICVHKDLNERLRESVKNLSSKF